MIIDGWAQPNFVAARDRLPMPEVRRLLEKSGTADRAPWTSPSWSSSAGTSATRGPTR
ncbi:hypothetical protein ACTXG6_27540 [Pseudonocardia sp. Cha107L01]|uniref:hypothetical protein n=1 Tax=Pseudonocardia sp. Cha107L01 TaxID=3457576 RepID=UPI00403E4971